MKRTALKRGTKTLKRSPLARVSKVKKKRAGKSDLQKAKAKLWELCKKITRQRYGNTCYTCGKTGLEGSNWQTGHFISSSICSTELRYDLANLRIQCFSCNINKSGNWLAFEYQLRRHHGDEYVTDLKVKNQLTKGLSYRLDWYEAQIAHYTSLLEP